MVHFDFIFGIVLVGAVLLSKAVSENILGLRIARGSDLVPASLALALSGAALWLYLSSRASWVDLLFFGAALLTGALMAVSSRKRLSG